MKDLINKNVQNIEVSGIRKISNKIDNDPDVVNLTFGQPNFPTPQYIMDAAIDSMNNSHTSYTETAGLIELRKAVSNYLKELYNLSYRPEDEIIITVGASEALDMAFRIILEEDSEVILPAPVYVGYEPLITLCNAKTIHVDTSDNEFKMNAAMIEKALTDQTKCVVLPYPSNPTGSVLSKEEIIEIGELLKNKHVFIIADEIYSELIYEGKHYSIGNIPELKDKTILINGLSKSHAMTGWRVGYACAPSYLIDQFYAIHSFNTICAPSISQYAATEALKQGVNRKEIIDMKEAYRERREFVYHRLNEMGLEVNKPEGAFYIFPSIKMTRLTSEDFADRLLEEENVAVIPGSAFSEYGEGYIRISYAQSMDTLNEGLKGIEKFISKLR